MAVKPISVPTSYPDYPFNENPMCSRKSYLEGKDMENTYTVERRKCDRIRRRAGYETLTKLRYPSPNIISGYEPGGEE